MKQLKKITLTLALLITAAAGAWAQDADEVAVTKTANNNEWTLTMPANNVELQVEYYAESNIFLSKDALADKTSIAVTAGETTVEFGEDGKSANTVTEGTPVTVSYTGTKKVIGVKAEKKAAAPAGPVTYTELKGGEVLKPGDILNFSDANVRYLFSDCNLMPQNCPFTVIRANITGDEEYPTVTPADDGAYYVIQDKNGNYYFTYKNLPVTATSDGILITINSENGNYRNCTASVHEP